MPALGNPNLPALFSKLDPAALVRLARDILFCRGHSAIKITDGPGDATRDVFSITPQGKKHLTQCKFHRDVTHKCSNSEVAELPLGMHKHGYSMGLFITNAGLSAPAKREYLDNYPLFNMEFLDGQELLSVVLDDFRLKALWFDGQSLASLTSKIVFPIIIRIHNQDRPLLALRPNSPALSLLREAVSRYRPIDAELTIEANARNHWPPTSFEPYRAPQVPDFDEGGMPMMMVLTLSLSGPTSVKGSTDAPNSIARNLAAIASATVGTVTVVVGRPILESNLGETTFKGAQLPISTIRIVGDNQLDHDEADWFFPSHENWSTKHDARTGQEPYVRLYHPTANAALSYRIRSPMTPEHRMATAKREHSWNKCIYALIPATKEATHLPPGVPEPDDIIPWGEGIPILPTKDYQLATWWHSHYVREGLCIEPKFNYTNDNSVLEQSIQAESLRLCTIETLLGQSSAHHPISPFDAGYLTQIGSRRSEETEWDTADIMLYLESIPGPVDPSGRVFECEIAWDTEAADSPDLELDVLVPNAQVSTNHWRSYLIIKLHFKQIDLTVCTPTALTEVEARMNEAITTIEKQLPKSYKRSTRQYWWRRYRVRLGLDYGDQDPSDGSIS